MAASVAEGDRVIPATLLGSSITPITATLDVCGVSAQPPHVGFVFNLAGSAADVLWDDGLVALALPVDDAAAVSVLKLGISTAAPGLIGKTVQLAGKSPEYQGVVLFVATLVAAPLNPASAPVDFVVVKSTGPSQIYWMAKTTDIVIAAGN